MYVLFIKVYLALSIFDDVKHFGQVRNVSYK